ncbi:MAG: patatin [Nocardioides sp.]|nr:patatin [Nocardioides sp.]
MPDAAPTVLVLDAGGARSAYQVGALEVLLPALAEHDAMPTVLLGTSAGALLSAGLAAHAHEEPDVQARALRGLLDRATKPHVIRPLWRQVPEVALRYASETIGLSRFRLRGLFGTEPLWQTLAGRIDWDGLHRNLDAGSVDLLAVTATAVGTGEVVLFGEGSRDLPEGRPRRYVRTRLGVEHLMASAAIPALFPSVLVDEPEEASGWYVDGATRRRRPLAPALELGAGRIVAVGTGSMSPRRARPERDRRTVDLGDGAATLLGAVMDDPMRHDLRRLAELNAQTTDPDLGPALDAHRARQGEAPYREIPYAAVAPTHGEEIAALAMEVFDTNHKRLLRTAADPDLHVIHRLLGGDSPLQGELLSYLLFDRDFFDGAADLGRRDARRWLDACPDLWWTGALDDEGMPTGEPAGVR